MKKTELPMAPLARIVKNAGAERISEDAKEVLAEFLEETATAVAQKAIANAKRVGRKTVKGDDIKLAINTN